MFLDVRLNGVGRVDDKIRLGARGAIAAQARQPHIGEAGGFEHGQRSGRVERAAEWLDTHRNGSLIVGDRRVAGKRGRHEAQEIDTLSSFAGTSVPNRLSLRQEAIDMRSGAAWFGSVESLTQHRWLRCIELSN
jgi:hypothetical protein